MDGPVVLARLTVTDAMILKGKQPCRISKAGCGPASHATMQQAASMQLMQQVPRPLRGMFGNQASPLQHQLRRQDTYLPNGSMISFNGSVEPRQEPPIFGLPMGMPEYKPEVPAIMDSSQQSPTMGNGAALACIPAPAEPAHVQPELAIAQLPPAHAHLAVSNLVAQFVAKAKSAPKAVTKKVAAKMQKCAAAKAFDFYAHGSYFAMLNQHIT